jgi:hypothetical protein
MAEEVKSSMNNLISVLTKKKKSTEKKVIEKADKDKQAMEKVQELLKNTPVAPLVGAKNEVVAEKEFDMEEHKSERSQKWLEDQVNDLNRQVEEYENEILFYKEEINKLNKIINMGGFHHGNDAPQQQGVIQQNNPIDTSINHQLTALFKHFENVYEKGFTQAKIAHPESGNGVLDLLQQYFPQLQQIRRYRYRGPEQH